MKHLVVSLVLLLSGCAGQTYVTKHGLIVHDNTELGIPRSEVEYIVDRGLTLFGGAKRLRGVYIYLIHGLLHFPYQKDGEDWIIVADGYTEPGERVYVSVFSRCLAYSSLLHELYHLITEMEHTSSDQWTELPILERITPRIIKERCAPEDIERERLFRNIRGKQPTRELN